MPLLPKDYEKLVISPGEIVTERKMLIQKLEKEVERLDADRQMLMDALCDDVIKSDGEEEICESVKGFLDLLVDVRMSQRLCYAQIEDLKRRGDSDVSLPLPKKRPSACAEIVCDRCGEKSPIDVPFCSRCGQRIEMGDTWRYCPDCKIAYCTSVNFCPQCGEVVIVKVKRKRQSDRA